MQMLSVFLIEARWCQLSRSVSLHPTYTLGMLTTGLAEPSFSTGVLSTEELRRLLGVGVSRGLSEVDVVGDMIDADTHAL